MIILYCKELDGFRLYTPPDAVNKLYYQEASIPTPEQIITHIKLTKSKKEPDPINKFLSEFASPEKAIDNIRIQLGKQDEAIPLYDVYSENLYLISKFNVYNRVVHQAYRFPTRNFYKKLVKDLAKRKSHQESDPLELRKINKLVLMIGFLDSFDLDTLHDTYIRVFYTYGDLISRNITTCKRPSFLPHFEHISPYYSRSEIINLALNMGIKLDEKYYEPGDINELCEVISSNDINANSLLEHQKYIIKSDCIGLVQYYTLQGSYFMNQYLRGLVHYSFKNEYLEKNIIPMWDLINRAPAFDKKYSLYRFISDDSYLKHLSIGDIYTENGFMSTTRDPFYRSDLYKFGFILIKINIPQNVKGVALCIETISHFPTEQEILLSPLSMFRLDKSDSKIAYYHTDENFRSQIKTLYEFTYIGKKSIEFVPRPLLTRNIDPIDFLKLPSLETTTLEEKLRYFISKYLNVLFQFPAIIGSEVYPIIVERYDSTGAYKPYYGLTLENGFLMYTIHNNHILFMIELGENLLKGDRYMHVNYYVKYTTFEREKIIANTDFIKFISSIAYYFNIEKIVIWADYKICDIISYNYNSLKMGQEGKSSDAETGYDIRTNLPDETPENHKARTWGWTMERYNKMKGGYNKPNKKPKQRTYGENPIDNTPESVDKFNQGKNPDIQDYRETGPRNGDRTETRPGKISGDIVRTSKEYLGGSYCIDFYTYLKSGIKKYSDADILNIELQPKFSTHALDALKTISHTKILRKDDQDELYQIWDKVYINEPRPNANNGKNPTQLTHNMADFFIWIAENRCYLMDKLVYKMSRFFTINNPFEQDYYLLDPTSYLYNKKHIDILPSYVVNTSRVNLIDSKNILPKNEYRLVPRRYTKN